MPDAFHAADVRRVAIVIPAHGSVDDLRRVLAHVQRLDHPRDRLQVIVGVDGPDPALEAVAAETADVVAVLPTNQGSYAARNAALDRLGDDVDAICFTDSDCLPDPGWVTGHLRALENTDLSGGAIEVTLRARPSAAEFVDRYRHLRQAAYVSVEGYAATANLAVRRAVVDAHRFNASLRSGGDAEFCRVATAAGWRLAYTPDAIVRHPARTTTAEVRTKVRRISTGIRSNPDRWRERGVPPKPTGRHVPWSAYREGISRNPVWLLHAFALERWAAYAIRRAVIDVKRRHGFPL